MKTLKLFNAVLAKKSKKDKKAFISDDGYVISPKALWAKNNIIKYYRKEKLNGNDLNKTFHKSWSKIVNNSRFELFKEQINHYLSTYGSDFKGEIYIPEEVLKIPKFKLKYKVIVAYTNIEMKEKCLSILRSGIALKEETVDDLISILVDEVHYRFTGEEGIKNKEAIVKIAETYQIYPKNPVEFFRYAIYRTTDSSLLIKNNELIEKIKTSSYNPGTIFKNFGLEKLAEVFNRFKPLFLAYKNKCPKIINKISKLSKIHHKPLTTNPLNEATQKSLTKNDIKWLDNANSYALFKVLSACYSRFKGQDSFIYRIRSGTSWVKKIEKVNKKLNEKNYKFLKKYIKKRFSLEGKAIYIPENIKYGLPMSEKMFVGNIPTGTKFYGKKLAVGIYWENSWGAKDLDLSGINIGGKTGWNESYQQLGSLYFSGDITSAPKGAVEYLYADKGLSHPTLVKNNVYFGKSDCEYKIIIGKGDKITKDYMMNPKNLFADIKCKSTQKQTILGIFLPENEKQCFVVLNFGAGHARVSGYTEISNISTNALYQQWHKPYSLNKLIKEIGGKLVESKEEADIDLSLDALEKDTIVKLFNN